MVGCNQSKVIEPLSSRCLCLRISAPTLDEISNVLIETGKKENVAVPPNLAASIGKLSNRNLRRALLMLEAAHTNNPDLSDAQAAKRCDWEEYIVKLAAEISGEQTPQKVSADSDRRSQEQ